MKVIDVKVRDVRSHEGLIELLSPLHDVKEYEDIHINLDLNTYEDFIYPDFLLLIFSSINYAKLNSKSLKGFVNVQLGYSGYISRMNFFELIGLDLVEDFQRRSSKGRFIEIVNVNSENDNEIANQISALFRKNTSIDKDLLAVLDYSIGEVLANIHYHAESDKGGWAVAQYYPNKNKIRVMICDNGIGVYESLIKNDDYSLWDEEMCLKKAIKNGVTDGKGMGYGLHFTSEFIKANKGKLMIYSGTHFLKVNELEESVFSGSKWKGTVVFLEIETLNKVNPCDIGNGRTDYVDCYMERYENDEIDDLW